MPHSPWRRWVNSVLAAPSACSECCTWTVANMQCVILWNKEILRVSEMHSGVFESKLNLKRVQDLDLEQRLDSVVSWDFVTTSKLLPLQPQSSICFLDQPLNRRYKQICLGKIQFGGRRQREKGFHQWVYVNILQKSTRGHCRAPPQKGWRWHNTAGETQHLGRLWERRKGVKISGNIWMFVYLALRALMENSMIGRNSVDGLPWRNSGLNRELYFFTLPKFPFFPFFFNINPGTRLRGQSWKIHGTKIN